MRDLKGTVCPNRTGCYSACRRRLGIPPIERRAELGLEKRGDLARFRESTGLLLAEHELLVKGDLEPTAAAALQLDRTHDRSPATQQLVRQAHGLVEVVSRNAVFDPHLVERRDHASMIEPLDRTIRVREERSLD